MLCHKQTEKGAVFGSALTFGPINSGKFVDMIQKYGYFASWDYEL